MKQRAGTLSPTYNRAGASTSAAIAPELPALAIVAVVYAVMWLAVSPLDNTPVLDDWVYALSTKSILETGRFTLPLPSSANFIVQAYWGALFCLPFGFSFEALRTSTFVAGMAGLLAFYLMLRELGAARPLAVIGALTLAANPLYLRFSASYMTDVPFTALSAIALMLYVRGVRRGSDLLVVAGYIGALLAIMVRQFALVLPLSFGVAHVLRHRFSLRSIAIGVLPLLACVAIHLGYEHWLIVTGREQVLATPLLGLFTDDPTGFFWRIKSIGTAMLPYFGFFTAPLIAAALLTRRFWLPATRLGLSIVAIGVVIVGLVWIKAVGLTVGPAADPWFPNTLTPYGVGPLFIPEGDRPNAGYLVYPSTAAAWRVITALSCFATAALMTLAAGLVVQIVARFGKQGSAKEMWPAALMLCSATSYAAAMLWLGGVTSTYDRYLIFLVVPLSGFVVSASTARPGPSRSWSGLALPGLILVLMALFSVGATHDYLAWNRAKWRAVDFLADRGVPPTKIDAGYEYSGWVLFDPNAKVVIPSGYYKAPGDDYIVTMGPKHGYEVLRNFSFSHWLWPKASAIDLLRRAPTQ